MNAYYIGNQLFVFASAQAAENARQEAIRLSYRPSSIFLYFGS